MHKKYRLQMFQKKFLEKAPDLNCTSYDVAQDENTKIRFHNHYMLITHPFPSYLKSYLVVFSPM